MKIIKKSICFILALLMLTTTACIAVSAAEEIEETIFEIEGTINHYNDSIHFPFIINKATKVDFNLGGATEGHFRLVVKNTDTDADVMEQIGSSDGDPFTYRIDNMAPGNYAVYVYNNDSSEDEGVLNFGLSCVKVSDAPKNPTKLTVNKKSLTMTKGKSYTLKVDYSPDYVTSDYKFSTTKKTVAKVNSDGKVSAKNLGRAVIKVKMGNKTVQCKVFVKNAAVKIGKGKSKSLVSLVKKVSGYKKAKWSSNKNSVATVSSKGVVKGIAKGKAKITAKIGKDKYTITTTVK